MNTSSPSGAHVTRAESLLALGNGTLRTGDYAAAIACYLRAVLTTPALRKIIVSNLVLARHKYRAARTVNERLRVAVCGWARAHNATDRVDILTRLYETFADVESFGINFPDGNEVAQQIHNSLTQRHIFVVADEGRFLELAIEFVAAHPYDVIHLVRSRTPNIIFGILYKLIWDATVLVDIDDDELLTPVDAESPVSAEDYVKAHGKLPDLTELGGKDWGRLAVGLAKEFDGITVCNLALQQRCGGEIISPDNLSTSKEEMRISSNALILKKLSSQRYAHLDYFQFDRKKFIGILTRQFGSEFLVEIADVFSISELAGRLKNATPDAARLSEKPKQKPRLPRTALVITWDVGHNPLGRSCMLAELLDRIVRNVVLIGFQFPRYGNDVWGPLRDARLPVISLPGENLPQLLDSLDRIAQRLQPDIVFACKPRLPSLQLGLLIKHKFGCPLVVDIDDHELSCFGNAPELTSEELARMPDGALSDHVEPYGEIWTRLAQHMCKYADARVVSTVALQNEFGGTIIPMAGHEHLQDLTLFDKSGAAEKDLRELVERLLRADDLMPIDDLPALLAHQRRLIGAKAPVAQPRAPGIDIIVFWKQDDTGIYGRRSDMIIRYLASRPDVRRVVVFDAPISEFELLDRRNAGRQPTQDRLTYLKTYEKVCGTLDTDKVSYNVFVYPTGTYRASALFDPKLLDGYTSYIKCVFDREGVQQHASVFWVYPANSMAPELVDRFLPAKIVVDVVDDQRAMPNVSAEQRLTLTNNYRDTLARAQMAFVNCDPMVHVMREFFPSIRMVQNGCDTNPPRVQPLNDPEFNAFMAKGGKVIGFVGNLEQKIDILLIAKVAERFSDCQIVLLGSTHINPQVLQLKRYHNVRMPGVVPYEQVGAWLARFDVGIIPHLDLEMTHYMNPLKLYVYLSWRVPVVSTEVYNIDKSSQFVRVARTHDAFLQHVASTLAEGKMDSAALQRYIDENSWEARFRSHVDELLAPLKMGINET